MRRRDVLFVGLQLREPVAARGPFVMNTAAELNEAFAEYRAQGSRFGSTRQPTETQAKRSSVA